MSVWTLVTAIALALYEEAADFRLVALDLDLFLFYLFKLLQFLDDLRLLIRQLDFVDLASHVVGPEVAVRLIFRHYDLVFALECLVSHFNSQIEVQIIDTRLADVLQPRAGLADLGLLVSGLAPGLPPEYGEWARADFAFPVELRFRHAHVWIVAKARLAEDWKAALFPRLLGGAGADA